MVLMALDHVRVFSGVPAGGTTPALFFTRWITHFCAPAFFFLAGSSAFLYARRHGGLARFLVTRGLWLVFLELTLLRFFWTFNLDAGHLMAGVIWALGWCMILLAGLLWLRPLLLGVLGLVVIAGHNLLDVFAIAGTLDGGVRAALWKIGYVGFFAGPIPLGEGGASLIVLYSLVPWIGVMAAGYGFGAVFAMERESRERWCLAVGLGATLLFVALRSFDGYGDPWLWTSAPPDGAPGHPAWLAFLNTSKYPASLDFLLMTLGPCLALVPFLERLRGGLAHALSTFGRVPFFFYLLHLPLIHALALAVSGLREGRLNPWLFENHPMGTPPVPEGYTWPLYWLYLVWAVACVLLWFACRWFAAVKERRRDPWLSYL